MPSRFEYERAIRSSELPSLSRLLALTVATWADVRTGRIPDNLQPSLTALEDATGMVRASVRKHLDTLEDGGWLRRDRPPVAAARSKKERTKYTIKIPRGAVVPDSDGIELGQEMTGARAARALADEKLGQEMPQARAGDALELGHLVTGTRAGDALSSSSSSSSSVQVPPSGAAVALSGRGEVQPLIEAMAARGMTVSWTFSAAEWIDLRDAVRRAGIPALVDHAARAWQAARTQPYSARYFLRGWSGVQAPTAYTGPRALTGPPSKNQEYLDDMAQIARELREQRLAEERRAAGGDA
ncbi:helix-turn-helix domain-containing protein [Streptomyces sp. NPDC058417]|uniref:helix-turn-helix domain-containing protein n=1 Tax=unclassified Streptomyces TaxID=2593676 RepID=UPI00365A22D4